MKKLPARYEELLSYYQRWLNGYTKLSICQDVSFTHSKQSLFDDVVHSFFES